MAYPDKVLPKLVVGTHAEVDLTSAAVQSFSWLCMTKMTVNQLYAKVTTATVSNVSIVLTFWKRPTFGSATGKVSLGTLTIPTATAVNKIYYKNITPVTLANGDDVIVEVTTAAGGGGAAGKALCDFMAENAPEDPRNDSNFVASA